MLPPAHTHRHTPACAGVLPTGTHRPGDRPMRAAGGGDPRIRQWVTRRDFSRTEPRLAMRLSGQCGGLLGIFSLPWHAFSRLVGRRRVGHNAVVGGDDGDAVSRPGGLSGGKG